MMEKEPDPILNHIEPLSSANKVQTYFPT